jgi:phosphoribosylglycinamide formyltransferase 1
MKLIIISLNRVLKLLFTLIFVSKKMPTIAIFASGSGSNAEQLIKYFLDSTVNVGMVVTNKSNAGVVKKAKALGVEVKCFSAAQFMEPKVIIDLLKSSKIDLIVLAGFLLKINAEFIDAFSERIINLHPSLLPKYGGKGMYGRYVHEAVLANQEKRSGISIHLVNEKFDEGRLLEQHAVELVASDDLASLTSKVQLLEHQFFPKAIENYLISLKLLNNYHS